MPRVLVVDDERDIRTLLRMVLEGEGFTVETAQNGDEALAFLLAAQEPWVVLLDVNMPRRSGLEVCAVLADPSWRGRAHRVILMSARVTLSADSLPVVRQTVRKPLRLADLLPLLRRVAHGIDGPQEADEGDAADGTTGG
jgi:CheY-like chemotaxis protein